jgi:peptide-methionine (R)-S-oxide reductase
MRRAVRLLLAALLVGCGSGSSATAQGGASRDTAEHPERFADPPIGERLELSEDEWRERLTAEELRVLREEGTERAFSGRFHDHHAAGVYRCAGCGAPLFRSEAKFDSGTGWPSYSRAIEGRVETRPDRSMGMVRTEVECARCGGHLGHVFEDGPPPTGLRYCINSVALDFEPRE